MKKATGLGRGLSALIDEAVRPPKADPTGAGGGVRAIEVGRIRANPLQPRKNFDEAAIDELTASIVERGVLQHGAFVIAEDIERTVLSLRQCDSMPSHPSSRTDGEVRSRAAQD